jgi:hypothetical protein
MATKAHNPSNIDFITLISTSIFQYILRLQVESPEITFSYTISNETVVAQPIELVTNAPAYFTYSVAIYAYIASPYASDIPIFDFWLSVNSNSSWVEIPLLSSQTNDRNEMAYLGTIPLSSPTIFFGFFAIILELYDFLRKK